MGRPATGTLVTSDGKRGPTYSARVTRPDGKRRQVRIGSEAEGWTRPKAEAKVREIVADLHRGLPTAATPTEPKPDPLFAAFAFEWFERVKHELRPGTINAYDAEVRHLLGHFGRLPLSAITAQGVDRFRGAKVAEGLSSAYINSMITRLAQIVELAVEYGYLDRNPARGRNRRLKQSKPKRTFLEDVEQIEALLDAAGTLDRAGRSRPYRRSLLSVLVFAGLRIDEALSLRWADVNLPSRRLKVGHAKTDAGVRSVDMRPALVDALIDMRARSGGVSSDLVFATATGGKLSAANVRRRLFVPAVKLADAALDKAGHPPLPRPLTPHSLRRTYISFLLSLGEPVPYTMQQAGHSDPKLTLSVYAKVMRRSEGDTERLRALVDGATVAAGNGANERLTIPTTEEEHVG